MIDFKQEIFLMSPYHVIAALGMTKVLESEKKNYLWEQNEKKKTTPENKHFDCSHDSFFCSEH